MHVLAQSSGFWKLLQKRLGADREKTLDELKQTQAAESGAESPQPERREAERKQQATVSWQAAKAKTCPHDFGDLTKTEFIRVCLFEDFVEKVAECISNGEQELQNTFGASSVILASKQQSSGPRRKTMADTA